MVYEKLVLILQSVYTTKQETSVFTGISLKQTSSHYFQTLIKLEKIR